MNTTAESFVQQLLRRVPELKKAYDEHMADPDGLLPHVLFGDVTRFAIAQADQPRSRDLLLRLLEHMESGLAEGSDEVQELVAVSFVENLCGEDSTLEILRPIMGPALKKALQAACG